MLREKSLETRLEEELADEYELAAMHAVLAIESSLERLKNPDIWNALSEDEKSELAIRMEDICDRVAEEVRHERAYEKAFLDSFVESREAFERMMDYKKGR